MKRKRASGLALLVAVVVTASTVGQAIVIRHDTGYTRYEAREVDYPAVFYLHRDQRRRICVATLIHPRWAVTAAHCMRQTPLGEWLAEGRDWPVEIAGQSVRIDRVRIHPEYPESSRADRSDVDLALLRLSRRLESPRPLPIYRDSDEQGRVLTFLGWGHSGIGTRGGQVHDGTLRFARNRVEQAADRLHFVFDDPRGPGSEVVDFEGFPGLGDSGGPALIERNGRHHLVGVAVGEVASEQRGEQGMYGAEAVYERLSRHQEWIDETIGRPAPEH